MNRAAQVPSPAQMPDYITIFDVIGALKARALAIAVITLLAAGAAAAGAFLMTPVYQAAVTLIPSNEDRSSQSVLGLAGEFAGLASIAGVNLGGPSTQTNEALAVLRSRAFTEKFLAEEAVLPALYAELWNPTEHAWNVPEDEQPTPRRAYRYFNEEIRRIVVNDDTGIVTVSIDWVDPELAATWANKLISRLNEYLRERAINEAQLSVQYLTKELEKTNVVGLQAGIYRLIEHQISNIMLAEVREQYAFRIIDPAVVSPPDAYVRPKAFLMIVAALFIGLGAGVFYAVLRLALDRSRMRPTR